MSIPNICPPPSCKDCYTDPMDCSCPAPKTIEYQECPTITPRPTLPPTPSPTCPPAKTCPPCIKSCPQPECHENFQNYKTGYFSNKLRYKDSEDSPTTCQDCLKPVSCPAENCENCQRRSCPLCNTSPIRILNNKDCPTPIVYYPTQSTPRPTCPPPPSCPDCDLTCPHITCAPKPTPCPTPSPAPASLNPPPKRLQSKYCGKYINTGCGSGGTDYLTSEEFVDAKNGTPNSNCASGYVPGIYSLIKDEGFPLIAKGSTYNCASNDGNCHQLIPNVWSGICQCKPTNFVDSEIAYDAEKSEMGDLIYIRCGGESDVNIPGGEGNFEWWGAPVINSEYYPNSKYPPGAIPPRSKSYSCAELCEKNYHEELSDEAHSEYYIPGIDKIVRLDSRHLS